MLHWNTTFQNRYFWLLYFRAFFWPGYDGLFNDPSFNEIIKKVYGEKDGSKNPQRIIIDFPQEYQIHITFLNTSDAGNQDKYTLHHPSFKNPLYLGDDSPHFSLPIFRWEELEYILKSATPSFDSKFLPLLLLKTVGISSYDEVLYKKALHFFEGAGIFTEDLKVCVQSEQINKEIPLLVKMNLHVNPELTWRNDEENGWLNNQVISTRKATNVNNKVINEFIMAIGHKSP